MTPGGMCSSDAASVAASPYCSTQSSAAYSASRARGSQRRGLLPFRLGAAVLPVSTITPAFTDTLYTVNCAVTEHLLCTYCIHVHAADLLPICCACRVCIQDHTNKKKGKKKPAPSTVRLCMSDAIHSCFLSRTGLEKHPNRNIGC